MPEEDARAMAEVALPSGAILQTIAVGRQPHDATSAGGRVFVGDEFSGDVSVIDAATLRGERTLPAGSGPTHVVVDALGRLVVVDTRGNSVDLYAANPLALLSRFRLPGTPYGIASDPLRKRLWVTLTARNQLVELAVSATGLRRVATFASGRQANTVTVDGANGDPVVANRAEGTIELIRPRRRTRRRP